MRPCYGLLVAALSTASAKPPSVGSARHPSTPPRPSENLSCALACAKKRSACGAAGPSEYHEPSSFLDFTGSLTDGVISLKGPPGFACVKKSNTMDFGLKIRTNLTTISVEVIRDVGQVQCAQNPEEACDKLQQQCLLFCR